MRGLGYRAFLAKASALEYRACKGCPVQPSAAVELQPALTLLEKTPIVLETLLPDLPQEILE